MRPLLLLLALVSVPGSGLAARILFVLPFPGKSHQIFANAIMKALVDRGHHVVEYGPYPPKKLIPNHTHVDLQVRFKKRLDVWTYDDLIKHSVGTDLGLIGYKVRNLWLMNHEVCEDTFNHESIQKLLKSNEQFDLVMTESTFGEESLLIFGHKFSAPTVTIESFFPWSILNRDAGNALSIASVPDLTSYVFENDFMSFKERFFNFISIMLSLFFYHYTHLPKQDEIIKKSFNYPNTPSAAEMAANVSLYLTNSHPAAVNYIRPYTPNIIPIGGINIGSERPPLSQEMQKFLSDGNAGFIYFSFGTVVPVHDMPKRIHKIFMKVFEKLPQKVIWKIELDHVPGLPKNVMITKWVPQLTVLAHPKCQLFITHGGLFSHQEALYSGVPTVGVPFFTDQHYNVRFAEQRGLGVKLDFSNLSEESLYLAITRVTNNPKYKENAERFSRVYRDRPVSPADSVGFWVEHVLKHRGAPHLKPASAALSWYQLALLDVLAALVAILFLIVTVAYVTTKKLLIFVCGRQGSKTVSRKKKEN